MSQPIEPTAPGASPEIRSGVRELAQILWQQSHIVLSLVFLCVGAAGLFIVLAPPTYQTTALVQVDPKDNKSVTQSLTDQITRLTGSQAVATAEIELLTSRVVIGKVFDELALDVTVRPRTFPIVGSTIVRRRINAMPDEVIETLSTGQDDQKALPLEALFGLDQYAWGGEKLKLASLRLPRQLLNTRLSLVVMGPDLFELYDENGDSIASGPVGAKVVGASAFGTVEIRVAQMIARPGQIFYLSAPGRAEAIRSFLKNFAVSQKGIDTGVIQLTLRGQDPRQITEILNSIVNSYVGQNVGWKSTEALQTLTFLNAQLPEFKAKVDAAQSALSRFKVGSKSADLPAETNLKLNQVGTFEESIMQLRDQRSKQLQLFRENHPSVIALNAQIAQAEAGLARVKSRIVSLPNDQKEQTRLQTDVDVSTRLYTSLLDSIQQLEIAKAGTAGDVRVVDFALVPTVPVSPKPKIIAVAAPIVGVVLGVFVAVLLATLRRRVTDTAELSALTGLQILSEIPFSKRVVKKMRMARNGAYSISFIADPEEKASEGIRTLRTALQLAAGTRGPQSIVFTGPQTGTGSSFVSVNLAASLASVGSQVVLIDANLRAPSLSRYFGHAEQSRPAGLSDWLGEKISLKDVLQSHPELGGLSFLPAGSAAASAPELLKSDKLVALVTALKTRFDYVLVDTPAVMVVSDALLIAQAADAVVMVFQEGLHAERELTESVARLKRSRTPLLGAVFNKVSMTFCH